LRIHPANIGKMDNLTINVHNRYSFYPMQVSRMAKGVFSPKNALFELFFGIVGVDNPLDGSIISVCINRALIYEGGYCYCFRSKADENWARGIIYPARFRENGLFEFKDALMTSKTAYPDVQDSIIHQADRIQRCVRPQRLYSALFDASFLMTL
jgi:hypothetical protein